MVQVTAGRWATAKPLPEPIVACTDVYMSHIKRQSINKHNPQFQVMEIFSTTISNIEEMAFAEIHNLRLLSLVNARLMTMPPLKPVESTLYKLSLARNNISVPRGYFFGFKKLSILCLLGNAFKEIPDITALKNSLTKIILDFNKIYSIAGWLNETTYPQLTDIHLSDNVMITFNPEVLLF